MIVFLFILITSCPPPSLEWYWEITYPKEEGRGEKEKEETGNSSRYPLPLQIREGGGECGGRVRLKAEARSKVRGGAHAPVPRPPVICGRCDWEGKGGSRVLGDTSGWARPKVPSPLDALKSERRGRRRHEEWNKYEDGSL